MYKPGGCGSLTILRELTSCSCIESHHPSNMVQRNTMDHESNYRVFPTMLYQVVITGFSSQYLYCLIKWLTTSVSTNTLSYVVTS